MDRERGAGGWESTSYVPVFGSFSRDSASCEETGAANSSKTCVVIFCPDLRPFRGPFSRGLLSIRTVPTVSIRFDL